MTHRLSENLRRVLLIVLFIASGSSLRAQTTHPITSVKGIVVSQDGSVVPSATIRIKQGDAEILSTKAGLDGKFTLVLQPASRYRVLALSTDFAPHEEPLFVPSIDSVRELNLRVKLRPVADGDLLTPEDPIFRPKSSAIQPASTERLNDLITMVSKNKKLSLGIAISPDKPNSNGGDVAQNRLVDARGEAIRAYFMQHGLPADKLKINLTSVPPGTPLKTKKKKKTPPAKLTVDESAKRSARIVAHVAR